MVEGGPNTTLAKTFTSVSVLMLSNSRAAVYLRAVRMETMSDKNVMCAHLRASRWASPRSRFSVRLVSVNAESFELASELGHSARQLLPPRVMSRRLKLAVQFGVREPQRFGTPDLFGILIGLTPGSPRPLLLALVHPLLNAILGVD
jgi:hypothetical protein